MPLAKLYTNSLMSTLNSRRMWMSDFCEADSMSFGVGGGSNARSRGATASGNYGNVNVNVDVVRSGRGGRARVRAVRNRPFSFPLGGGGVTRRCGGADPSDIARGAMVFFC